MKCVILQPFYIPWRGYFHQIQKADVFIFYDNVQYEKRGWCNRNLIKTANGIRWLTVPVLNKGSIIKNIPINEIEIDPSQGNWREKHWKTLQQEYRKAPFFSDYELLLTNFYSKSYELLADLTIDLTITLARRMGINKTVFYRSSEFNALGTKTDRLLSLLNAVNGTVYLTGEAAKNYIDQEKFTEANISLEYMDYDYSEYKQLYPPFAGQVSILDLLFMTGNESNKYIWNVEGQQV